jgi:hypothetical protein
MAELSFTQRVVVTPDTLINFVGNEAVLLNLSNEQYYGLDETGASIWQALTTNEMIQAAYEKGSFGIAGNPTTSCDLKSRRA